MTAALPPSRHYRISTAPERIESFPRDEFIDERWDYRAGEHVTFIAPTQWGKTTLAKQLLDATATKKLQAVILVIKPRDGVVRQWTRQDRYKLIRTWPPGPIARFSEPHGYILWPKPTYDPKIDDDVYAREFRKAIIACYKKGDKILFADEVWGLTEPHVGLGHELTTVWTRGASDDHPILGCGLWGATQRPAWVPVVMYGSASHLFLGRIADEKDRKRFREIGGIDPEFVEYHVMRLGQNEFLYIQRSGPHACIVQA
jgi:hypothetical protein